MENLAIIILNYNSSDQVINQVSKLMDEGITPSLFCIVDNCSSENHQKKMENFAKSYALHFIQSSENGGYAKGNHLGLDWAINQGKAYFLLLNPDIELSKNVIETLYENISKKENLYFVGPRICDKFQRDLIFSDGGIINKEKYFETSHVNSGKLISEAEKVPSINYDIDYVNGSVLMFKKETVRLLGRMREDFFMYFEETEWCYRLKKFPDAQQAILTNVSAYHEQSNPDSAFLNFYMTRNRIFFCRLYNLPHKKLISQFLYEAQKKLFKLKGGYRHNLNFFITQIKAIFEGEFRSLKP